MNEISALRKAGKAPVLFKRSVRTGDTAEPASMQEGPTTQASASCVEDVQGGEFDFGEAQEQLAGDDVAASEVSTQFLPLSSLVCP